MTMRDFMSLNMGDVRSINRYTKDGKFLKGKVLKQGLCTSGYKHVVFCKDGIKKGYVSSSVSRPCIFTK